MSIDKKWYPAMRHGVCIGIETNVEKRYGGRYSEVILNTILPNSDAQYEDQKEEIEGRVKMICDLYNNTVK